MTTISTRSLLALVATTAILAALLASFVTQAMTGTAEAGNQDTNLLRSIDRNLTTISNYTKGSYGVVGKLDTVNKSISKSCRAIAEASYNCP